MDDSTTSDAIVATGSVMKDCFDAGVYTGKKVSPALAGIVTIGLFVKSTIEGTQPDKSDAPMEEIAKIANTLGQIDEKMKEGFDDLKAMVSQYSFFNDVPMVSAVLARYAWEVWSNPNLANLEKFRKKYDAFPPVEYARRLNHQLTKDTTNPLKILMDSDLPKAKATVDEWHKNYEGALLQLMLIEAVAVHWSNEKSWHKLNLIKKEHATLTRMLQKLNDEYKLNDSNWKDYAGKSVNEVFETYSDEDMNTKATEIRKTLEHPATDDMFYVLIIPDSLQPVYYEHLSNRLLVVNKNGLSVFVYRSVQAYNEPASELIRAFNPLKNDSVRNVPGVQLGSAWFSRRTLRPLTNGLRGLGSCGVLIAAKATSADQVGLAWTRANKHKNGCGSYTIGQINHPSKNHTTFLLFAGYK